MSKASLILKLEEEDERVKYNAKLEVYEAGRRDGKKGQRITKAASGSIVAKNILSTQAREKLGRFWPKVFQLQCSFAFNDEFYFHTFCF
jgi:hypothetical protein